MISRKPVYIRPTPELREQLEAAMRESGRTMAREIEYRLERSFWLQDMRARLIFSDNPADNRT